MSIPAAVLRQAERSDAILSKLRAPETQPVTPPQPESTPPAEPVAPEATQGVVPAAPVEATPTAPPQPEQTEQRQREQQRTDWKQKFLSLEGKYRAEVPLLAAQLRDVKARLNEVTGKLLEAQDELVKLKSGGAGVGGVTEDAIDPTLAAVIDQRATRAAQKLVGDRVASIETRVQDDDNQRVIAARVKFENDVSDILHDSHGIDWREVDTLPAFQAYLAGRDTFSGLERQQLLTQAVANGDSLRAAAFFQDFLGKQRTPSSPAPQPPEAPPARDPREALVAPQRATAAVTPTTPEKKFYTRSEITSFYAEYAKKQVNSRLPTNELERLKTIDLDIQAAIREGRIKA